jgi:hypothetical protein
LHLRRAVAGLALAGFGGLDVSVDRARDGQISPTGRVLIDDRGALARRCLRIRGRKVESIRVGSFSGPQRNQRLPITG